LHIVKSIGSALPIEKNVVIFELSSRAFKNIAILVKIMMGKKETEKRGMVFVLWHV